MRFGRVPLAQALGTVSAHTLRLGAGQVIKKGRVVDEGDLAALREAGQDAIVAAALDEGDLHEDAAAALVGAAVAGPGLRAAEATTGRCNLHAEAAGLLIVNRERVDRLNLVDEAVTLATIAPFAPVRAGDLVATVKVIPFATSRDVASRCASIAGEHVLAIAPFSPFRAGLILTRLPGVREGVLDRAASAQRVRAARLGGVVAREIRCDHDEPFVAAAINALLAEGLAPILILGASAIVDRRDVIPAAVERAGGALIHLGMPVDPGNLLLLAHKGESAILGVPGCARSLRRSGFDVVLERLAAGLPVGRTDLMTMGVGGLLGDIPSRPSPRAGDGPLPEPAVAAIVLAAGSSRRMGARNKLLIEVDGAPILVHVIDAILATRARPVVVVTGHDDERVRAVLAGREVTFVHNPRHDEGMSTSLRAGIAELSEDVDGAMICLGDMPRIRPAHLEALLGAFDPEDGRALCVPTWERRRGNPVLFSARFFPEMRALEGDVGARSLLEKHAASICYVPMDDAGVTVDVDTPEALASLRKEA